MKIISWNVNGIRAWTKKGHFDWFMKESPDILCLQETKAEAVQLDPTVRAPAGYHAYFDHSKGRKGYSGVAIYTKLEPEKVEIEMKVEALDQEGRLLATYFKDFVLFNVYFPNGGGGPERLTFKLEFYDAFLKYINKIHKKGLPIIFCGDINTAHHEIDLARPKENADNTGFLPIEREWLDRVVDAGYVDVFRHFYPEKKDAYTYWDQKTFARDRNVGWRIDYFFVSADFMPRVKKMTILKDIFGSDHCPIVLEIQ